MDRSDARLVEQSGCERASLGEDLSFELGGRGRRRFDPRARLRSTCRVPSSSGVAVLERRRRLQRWISRWAGSARSSSRRPSGVVTITLRSWTSACWRTSTALRRASSSRRSASRRCPARGSASVLLARAARAARIASSGSFLPRKRRSLPADETRLENGLAACTQIAGKPGTVIFAHLMVFAGRRVRARTEAG